MNFIDKILQYRSCSIIGMEKNCGKTVVLNHILSSLKHGATRVAVTSIGVDGEKRDSVTKTDKPEIILSENTLFATCDMFYQARRLGSEIVKATDFSSPIGDILIANVIEQGRVIVSGPSDMSSTKKLIGDFQKLGANLVIVDGALSRKTSASPAVTECVVLCTGAAVSLNIDELVRKTKFTHKLIDLERADCGVVERLSDVDSGVWVVNEDMEIEKLADTLFAVKDNLPFIVDKGRTIYFSGIITDNIIDILIPFIKKHVAGVEIIVRDFTKIFITPLNFSKFVNAGGKIKVLSKCELIAICVNPLSPSGRRLNTEELICKLHKETSVEVLDVVQGVSSCL